MSERCETCRFWRDAHRTLVDHDGWCRRSHAYGPACDRDGWCGEWQAKTQEFAKPKARERGYYWVMDNGEWDLAVWRPEYGNWWVVGGSIKADADFTAIDERRLERQP